MKHTILGNFNEADIEIPRKYFEERQIFLDCRGTIVIPQKSLWGFGVVVLTASHSLSDFFVVVDRPVIVEEQTWIASCAFLYNCHIREGAIVGAGAIVKGVEIPSYTMVEGNPAMVVAQWNKEIEKWVRCEPYKPPRVQHPDRVLMRVIEGEWIHENSSSHS